MSDKQLILVAVAALWAAVLALGWIVAAELGRPGLRRHAGALTILVLALLSFPAAGVLKVGLRYKQRIVALVFRPESPRVELTGGCSIFPADNIWNTPASGLPVDAASRAYVEAMGAGLPLHADFGAAAGIPYAVTAGAPEADVNFDAYGGESDPGPYRIPGNAPVENGGDGHLVVVDMGACRLYELFQARHDGERRWTASAGARYDLRSNRLRPAGWTSADAAGLPIFPGLVRYDEVKAGRIGHALRFTTRRTRAAFVWPARHRASSSNDPALPPMGQRFRLKATVDLSGFSPEARVILTALKEYGMILADNGGPWYVTGAPDSRWSAAVLREMGKIQGGDFDAVDTSGLMMDSNSSAAKR